MTATAPPQTFHAWLTAQRHRNDPVGDLARDYVLGARLTRAEGGHRRATDPDDLRALLLDLRACDGALDSLDLAATEWARAAR
ncbi:hypothetical protein [Cellulosimicrobium sp. 22601]|uniref:hypothetical protein n=1 Tax=unclassified Cellulosimicrobium TaxID=2624466 RepID=UPI003F861242